MSAWDTNGLADALPNETPAVDSSSTADASAPKVDPQAHGWCAPTAYEYSVYNMTGKQRAEQEKTDRENGENQPGLPDFNAAGHAAFMDAANSRSDDWAGNAAVYEWKDEYGDVGPRFADIERMLFPAADEPLSGLDFSKIMNIAVIQEGSVQIKPVKKFEDAGLHPVVLENVQMSRYTIPTPIQQYTLPAIFKNYDVIAAAQTGSGKTAAFLLPIISKLMGKAKKWCAPRPNPSQYDPARDGHIRAEPLVLIVCPTRELATQIFDEARKLCYRTMMRPCVIYGGTPLGEQITQLGKGADILIATPGRLVDMMSRPQILSLRRLRYMVIDEADEMMQSDWETELNTIMSGGDQEEGNITYLMFSATFPKALRELAKKHLKEDHVRIRVGRIGSSHENIHQDVIFVEPHSKKKALIDLLMSVPPARTIIFVNSKRTADEIDDFLYNQALPTTSIHADRTQREREDSIRAFRSGKCPILIATGVTARGIDVPNVSHVINYDLPSSQHGGIEEYTHRIGRTGRIGRKGTATSFYNDKDSDLADSLVKTLLETRQKVPDFLDAHLPEGFTMDGQGDISKLHFDADSDIEDEENAEGGETGADAWGGGGGGSAAPATNGNGAWGETFPTVDLGTPAIAVSDPFGVPQPQLSTASDPFVTDPRPQRVAPPPAVHQTSSWGGNTDAWGGASTNNAQASGGDSGW